MRWADQGKWAASPMWNDFYSAFWWNLLSHFKQRVCFVTGKILVCLKHFKQKKVRNKLLRNSEKQITAKIRIIYTEQILLYYLINIKETLFHLAELAHLCMFIWKIFISPRWGSPQNQVRSHLGGLAHFSYEPILFLYEFFKEGGISPRWDSPPNRASSPPYEQPQSHFLNENIVKPQV